MCRYSMCVCYEKKLSFFQRFLLMPGGRYSSLIRPKGKRIEEKRGRLDCSFSLFGISRRIDAFAGMEIRVKNWGRRTASKFLTNMFGGISSSLGCSIPLYVHLQGAKLRSSLVEE